MPKVRQPVTVRLRGYAEEFASETLVFENNALICRCCGARLCTTQDSEMRRSTITQHIATAKHGKSRELLKKQKSLSFEKDTFMMELCQVRFSVQTSARLLYIQF